MKSWWMHTRARRKKSWLSLDPLPPLVFFDRETNTLPELEGANAHGTNSRVTRYCAFLFFPVERTEEDRA